MKMRIVAAAFAISLLILRGGTSVHAGSPPAANANAGLVLLAGESETLLPNGQILLIGGQNADGSISGTARIVNPHSKVTQSFTLKCARAWHTATVLPDGNVLVLGGLGKNGLVVTNSELFRSEENAFEIANGPPARAFHTATLTTEGLVAIVGGIDARGSVLRRIETWDFRTSKTTPSSAVLSVGRWEHNATLMADGTILMAGGKKPNHQPASIAEVFDPISQKIFAWRNQTPTALQTDVSASSPESNALDVPLTSLIAVRFSRPVLMRSLNPQNLTLTGPSGNLDVSVVGAEHGMLAFINPKQPLVAGTTYIGDVRGVSSPDGGIVPFWEFTFTTVTNGVAITSGASGNIDLRSLPSLKAASGVTALAGQVLTVAGTALSGVDLSIADRRTHTDQTGRFLLSEIPTGHQVLLVNADRVAGDNGGRGQSFGVYEIGVDIKQGTTTALPYTVWLTSIDKAHAVQIPSPTTQETVVSTPQIPGLELHIPAGTIITDHWGKTVREISITPIDVQKPPFPLPFGTPLFFTIQPGSAYVKAPAASGARLIYPNITHAAPKSFLPFWDYDADSKGWFVYGYGQVSSDGKQVVPNPGVEIYEFTGAMINGPPGPPRPPGPPPGGPPDGEPVDLATGLFVYKQTDLFLDDVIPLHVTRTYINNDSNVREFGLGMLSTYGIFLSSTNQYQVADLNMPDAQYHFVRTSPGTSWTDAVFAHTFTPTAFYNTQIVWNGRGWNLTLKNGLQYVFGENQPLQAIRDRYGNQITITRTSGDQSGNIVQVSSQNGRWIQFTYNSSNLVNQIKDSLGRTASYFYDAANRLSQVVDAKGGTTTYTYDNNNQMLTIQDQRGHTYLTNQYDANGRVSMQTLADGSTYHFAYSLDGNGNVTQTDVTDSHGVVRRVVFNANHYPVSDTLALGRPEQQAKSYTRDPNSNLPLTITDALSRQTSYGYDGAGNVSSITRLAGTSNAKTWSFLYDPTFNAPTQITDPLGHTNTFTYDGHGGMATRRDGLGNQWTYSHDSEGRLTSVADPLGNTTQFSFDATGLISITDPLGNTRQRTLDGAGRLLYETDQRGFRTLYTYDNLDAVTSIVDARGNTTSFNYDPNGNLLGITDPGVHSNTYSYDNMDRRITHTDPLNASEGAQYDGLGNLMQSTDRRGKVTTYSYDALNRLTFIGYGTQPGPVYESTVTLGYDAGNRVTSVVDSLAGSITRTYDGMDGVTSESSPQGAVSYTYDGAGRPATMTVAGQPVINYSFDNADRLTNVTQGTTSMSFSYDVASRKTGVTLADGITGAYTYDKNSRVTSITYKLGNTVLGDLTSSYDSTGHEVAVGGSLARVNIPSSLSSANYNANNQLTTWGTTTLTYDANGNVTNDGINTYVWDGRNMLKSMNSGAVTFQYDGMGRRIGTTLLGSATSVLYDGLNPIQELLNGTPTANSIFLGPDEVFLRSDSSGPRSFLTDRLGSTIALADSSGALQTQYTYDPFGSPSSFGPTSGNKFEYRGREFDATGLYYYRSRFYSPQMARFVSEDPLEFDSGSINLYSYVGDDPTDYIDPLGLRPLTACEKQRLAPFIPKVDLDKADVHPGKVPWYFHMVSKDFEGITRGNDIYFRPNVYDPSTIEGLAKLGHELVHVGQYRNGMTWSKYLWASRHSYDKNPYEKPAYDKQDEIYNALTNKKCSGCPN